MLKAHLLSEPDRSTQEASERCHTIHPFVTRDLAQKRSNLHNRWNIR